MLAKKVGAPDPRARGETPLVNNGKYLMYRNGCWFTIGGWHDHIARAPGTYLSAARNSKCKQTVSLSESAFNPDRWSGVDYWVILAAADRPHYCVVMEM